jgi:hypothetical protein
MTSPQPLHPSWLREPDPITAALARLDMIEAEIAAAHKAMLRDLAQAFTTPAALGRERD